MIGGETPPLPVDDIIHDHDDVAERMVPSYQQQPFQVGSTPMELPHRFLVCEIKSSCVKLKKKEALFISEFLWRLLNS